MLIAVAALVGPAPLPLVASLTLEPQVAVGIYQCVSAQDRSATARMSFEPFRHRHCSSTMGGRHVVPSESDSLDFDDRGLEDLTFGEWRTRSIKQDTPLRLGSCSTAPIMYSSITFMITLEHSPNGNFGVINQASQDCGAQVCSSPSEKLP